MSGCRRLAAACGRSSGLSALFSPVRPPTPLRRSHATAAERAPGSDAGDKPPLRAIDLARKVQREKEKEKEERAKPRAAEAPLSPQQRTVAELKRLSSQLQNVHPNVLAKHLHRGLLYRDDDLLVLNKPYGVPVRDSRLTSISSVLPVLSKMVDGMKVKSESQLFPCLALEKDATGVLLLARSEGTVEHILTLNKNNQVKTKYWVVTVGIPVPSEGVIDIPIIEREVVGPKPHYKMALSPVFRMNDAGDGVVKVRSHQQAQRAATKYTVLDSSSGCSLVELQPFTGVKHQLRVHMALALGCPILGDHKYSHWDKLAPQKLPKGVLGKLGLEQAKARHIPLHLHARQLSLPGGSQTDVDVSCPLPKYFTQTLSRLYLTPPEKKMINIPFEVKLFWNPSEERTSSVRHWFTAARKKQ
ncbi:pseudouridylate synthase RPUSD4, mitochondrial isoform X2 [Salarias fasciatus]|uniref:pseudouridylate synthase RPUSD4, mitochondrial isoform X2 n=1 Tax=Salarias fasciatus TaxID=181472 RepID=UPI001176D89B|nr:mitochondrial RNA pseudouridine synthase RPUSD4 isoform X2 [Salarias fasciatus]